MKNTIRLALLVLCLSLSLAMLASCGESTPEGWQPTGEDITLIGVNEEAKYLLVYAAGDELAHSAIADFKDRLTEEKLKTAGSIMTDTMSDEKAEIIFGAADRDVSRAAKALLDEKVKSAPDDLHCVYHYMDGRLAIVANSELAYEMALLEFFNKYLSSGSIVFADTLKEHISISSDDYLDRRLEIFLESSAETKAEHAEEIDDLLAKLETQRNDLQTSKFFGTSTKNIGSSNWGTAPTDPIDEHPRLLLNKSMLPQVLRSLMLSGDVTNSRILGYFDEEIKDDCILPEATFKGTNNTVDKDNEHNFNETYLEMIQIKALAYLVTEDPYYGYEAILYLKNYIKSLDIVKIASDQCRQYGYVMFTAAIVYDWCYDLLTDVDKEQIIAGVENRICRGKNEAGAKMEVGFPPSGQGVVSGHGSERQILRDYLAFATAIYGDNDSWWDYIAARVFNDYAPMRNLYYQSGLTQQGTGYMTGRYISDLFSAWIIKAATGVDLYEGQDTVTRSILGLECAPGRLFNDGDGGGDSKAASEFVHVAYITAYLYGDPTLLAQANHLLGDKTLSNSYSYLNSVLFAAVRGLSDIKPAEDRYEGMELIQYNGSPLGQYVIRSAWNSEDSAAVMMRIKERTTGNHEHEDSGTFEIYYKGALSTDGGCYNNYGHAQTRYYHSATVSHNGLLIFNPSKWNYDSSNAATKWYSGGQRRLGETNTLNGWLNSKYDTGLVTGRQHGYADEDKTSPLYAYIAGDITKAYDSNTVSYVGRRMLTVYTGNEEFPMAFFVYDDISAKNKTYEKRFLLQISSKNAPTIDNKDKTVITENGEGRLVLTCLSDDVQINGVGGRNEGAYKANQSQNYLIQGKQLTPKSNSADDGHWGRVEIVYDKDSMNASFMNVLYVTDKGNEKTVNVRSTSGDDGLTGGIFDRSIVALFATSRERATETISCKTYGSASMSYYVSGVAAGSWTVKVDGKSVGTYEATKEGGLLTFTAPAGMVEISPAK